MTTNFAWKFEQKGRAWQGDELDVRVLQQLPESARIEVQNGKLLFNEEERLTVLAMLIENVGINQLNALFAESESEGQFWRVQILPKLSDLLRHFKNDESLSDEESRQSALEDKHQAGDGALMTPKKHIEKIIQQMPDDSSPEDILKKIVFEAETATEDACIQNLRRVLEFQEPQTILRAIPPSLLDTLIETWFETMVSEEIKKDPEFARVWERLTSGTDPQSGP